MESHLCVYLFVYSLVLCKYSSYRKKNLKTNIKHRLQISLFKEYKENPAQTLIQCITSFHGNTHILFENTCTYQQINKLLYNTITDGYSTKIKNNSIIYHIAISKIKFDLNKYETFDFDF